MGGKADAKRERIVDSADRLFYRRGYRQTSFTEIAREARLPRGNFYYYFRSKDAILAAVMAARVAAIEQLLAEWDAHSGDPRQRLGRFMQMLRGRADELSHFGCPFGTLAQELGKAESRPPLPPSRMFEPFHAWLSRQFEALGLGAAAPEQAMHVLVRAQGATQMSHIYGDPAILERELDRLREWVDGL